MADNRYYGVRVEGAKYGVGFGSALAIAISYTANHSILWAIIHGILGWLYVIYYALFRSWSSRALTQAGAEGEGEMNRWCQNKNHPSDQ
jgi:hypothetical protein